MNRMLLCCTLLVPLLACHYKLGLGAPNKQAPPNSLNAGATCAQSSDCDSGVCMTRCCDLANCPAEVGCQATGCDESGACQYPTVSCAHPFCDTSTYMFTQSSCVNGFCVGDTSLCPGSLVCADQSACLTRCAASSDCTGLNLCDAGTCVPVLANGGVCASNSACFSGICGVAGSGHCCAAACDSSDTLGCAATDCDAVGSCVYPDATTGCVALSCTGHVLTEPSACNGIGHCAFASPATADCSPYLCNSATTCGTSCTAGSDCVALGWCDVPSSSCCAGYPGGVIEVDGTLGVDQPCCGSAAGAAGCATIAYSVQLAGKSAVQPLAIHVSNPPNGSDWVADSFPIQLSFGVRLNAPGVAFWRPGPWAAGTSVFHIAPFGSETTTSAIVEGSVAAPILVGGDLTVNASSAATAIQVDGPMTLYLLNATIWNPDCCRPFPAEIPGITVLGGATLTLGTDGQGASGEVVIGSVENGSPGEPGIYCAGTDSQHLAVVNDQGSQAPRSLQMGSEIEGIDAEDYCSVNLSANPLFGVEPNAAGKCPFVATGVGIWVVGNANVALSNAAFECSGRGVFAKVGTVALTDSLFSQNDQGLMIIQSAVLDLTGGGNSIFCNLGQSPSFGVNLSTGSAVNLGKTAWNNWDGVAGHTEIWTCDAALANCTCTGASTCPSGSQNLPGNADIVITDSTTTVDDANGSLAPNACP